MLERVFNCKLSDFYQENQVYAVKVIWKSNHKTLAKNKQSSSFEMKCKEEKFLNTSKWMCKNREIIDFNRVCDGYKNTTKDCSDASDESARVCSVEVPYDAIGVIVSYILIGMIAFTIYNTLKYEQILHWFNRHQPATLEMSQMSQEELPSHATTVVGICSRSVDGNVSGVMENGLEAEAKQLYCPCTSESGKKDLFRLICTLSLYTPFRDVMLNLTINTHTCIPLQHFLNPITEQPNFYIGF